MFDGSNFRGANFQANWPVYNLDGYGFNDRASSVIVDRGRWQFCEDANFQGRCVTLQSGQYPTLNDMGLNGRISSMRPAGQQVNDPYPPAKPPGYSYYPRYGEPTFQAQVTHRCARCSARRSSSAGPSTRATTTATARSAGPSSAASSAA